MTARDRPTVDPVAGDRGVAGDAELVAGVLRCSFESLAGIYERHSTEVHGLARRLCGRDADEVVRNVFLELWRAPDAYDPAAGTLAEFLSGLTFAAAVEHLRRISHERDLERRREASERTRFAAGVGHAAWHALDKLPPALRDAIALAHLSGYSYAEIAERLALVDVDVDEDPRRPS